MRWILNRVEAYFLRSFGKGVTGRTGTGEAVPECRIKIREEERPVRRTGRDLSELSGEIRLPGKVVARLARGRHGDKGKGTHGFEREGRL